MSNTRDEIMNTFAFTLKEAGDWDEKVREMRIPTHEELFPQKPEESVKLEDVPEKPKSSMSGEREWAFEGELDEKTKNEVMQMIKEDPIHVMTNLMIQRKPEFQNVKFMLPLARGVVGWLSKSNISPEQGTLLYDESSYILNLLESLSK